tara:strand:- start:7407 stop:9857 length:2451 start_codon:yes stop_codon:yes gene_type:complete
MAKVFGGFTPEQMGKIVPEMQGMQADEQAKFLAATPSAASRVGMMAEQASKRIGMAQGGYVQGGLVNQAVSGLANIMPSLAQGNTTAFENFLGTPSVPTPVQPDLSNTKFKPGTPVQPRPNIDEGFYNSPEYTDFKKNNTMGTQDMYDSPYFGSMGSGSMGRAQDSAYEAYLANRANQGGTAIPDTTQPPSEMNNKLDTAQQNIATANAAFQQALDASTADPTNKAKSDAVSKAQIAVNNANAAYGTVQKSFKVTELPSADEFSSQLYKDPASVVSESKVATASEADKAEGMMKTGTGAIKGDAPQATVTTAGTASPVVAPEQKVGVTYDALPATASVEEVLTRLEAATGKPSAGALADAANMNPQELAQLGLDAAQIAQATTVVAPEARKVEAGELIEGSAVDMDRVRVETNFEAATGAPSTDATVQGQLTGLMADFEGSNPPAWAAGAMRNAAAMMASRGLSASSMAGQAAIQAAMESALPIAQIDSATFAKFESQNLSNKQQSAMFAAEKRAEFLGLEFNQEFQSRVANASRISDIANINFSAEQQIALENARMAQTVDLTNLNSQNAKILADAAAMSQMDMANLSNRQQAQITNAQSFLQMDMASLNNTQQTSLYKAQQNATALLSDQAADNASKQFNATSENQSNQFFSNLAANIAIQNSEQANAMAQFNAGETNSLEQYNATQRTARQQFNATNALVVAQANATWSQSITTAEIAAQNQSNREAAMTANEFTMASYNAILQEERDLVSYAFKTAESQAERELRVQLAALEAELSRARTQAELDASRGSGFGKIIASIAPTVIEYGLGKLG